MKSFVTHISTDFPAIIFFALLLLHIQIINSDKESIVTKADGLCLRGAAALSVLLYHLAPLTENGVLLPKFYTFGAGALAVAMFFFLSGYGLQKQYLKNGDAYRKSFLKGRIPTVLIPLILFAVLYRIAYYTLGKTYTFHDLISDICVGIPFVAHSWYLITILLFYLFFWLLMNLFKGHTCWMPIAACVWYLLYALICIKLKYLMYWYDTACLLPVGMFCAVYEQRILNVVKEKWMWYSLLLITAVFFWFVIPWFYVHGLPMSIQLYYILSISRVFFFTMMLLLLQVKIRIDNPVLRYLGKISLEIYLIHGLIFYLLRGDYFYLTNEPLFCFLSLSGVLLFASILSPIDRFLVRSWKQAVK